MLCACIQKQHSQDIQKLKDDLHNQSLVNKTLFSAVEELVRTTHA